MFSSRVFTNGQSLKPTKAQMFAIGGGPAGSYAAAALALAREVF